MTGINAANIMTTPTFKGSALLKKATEIIPNTKACKNLTELDRYSFRAYVETFKYRSGVTQEEINKLFSMDGMDFLSNTYMFILKKMGLQNLTPQANIIGKMQNFEAAFKPDYNSIEISQSLLEKPKAYIYAIFRHELQHYKQHLDVMRHEKIGPESVEFWAKELVARIKQTDIATLKMSDEKLKNLGVEDDALEKVRNLRNLYINEPEKFDEYYENMYKLELNNKNAIRNQVINELGIIKEGSPLDKTIRQYFEEFKAQYGANGYYNKDNSVNLHKYYATSIEKEAILAQERWMADITPGTCFYKAIKEGTINTIKQIPDKT